MSNAAQLKVTSPPYIEDEKAHRKAITQWMNRKSLEYICITDIGAKGNGIIDEASAFQAVYNLPASGATIYCLIPAGTYKLNTSPIAGAGSVIFVSQPGVIFTGAGTLPFTAPPINKGFRVGTGQPTNPAQGGILRLDVDLTRGDTEFALFTKDYTGSVTDVNDAVLFGAYAVDGTSTPRVWSQNINIVKKTTGSGIAANYACGIEVSAQNNTTVTGAPNNTDCLMAFFASYIGTGVGVNKGSAGFTVGGNGATANQGWNFGLWIDNITDNGVGISIRNASGNRIMGAALDTRSHIGAFQGAAILLGNNHTILSNDSGGTARPILNFDASNYLQIGDVSITNGIVLNSAGLLLPNITTSGTANAGAATLPANPVGFIQIAIAGTNRKIPYYVV